MSARMRLAATTLADDDLKQQMLKDADDLACMCDNYMHPLAPAGLDDAMEAVKQRFTTFNNDRIQIWDAMVALDKEDRPHWSGFVDGPHINDQDPLILPGIPPRAVPASSATYNEKPQLSDDDIPLVRADKVFLVPMVSFSMSHL